MKSTFFLVMLLTLRAHAQQVDSIKYKNEWVKIYPFSQTHYLEGTLDQLWLPDIFMPASSLPDGRYVQFYKQGGAKHLTSSTLDKKRSRIFAVFSIQNGKLNGDAYLFGIDRKLLTYGKYVDNTKSGKWYFGIKNQFYQTYVAGILEGECYHHYIGYSYWNEQYCHYDNFEYYQEGELTKSIRYYGETKGERCRDEEIFYSPDSLGNRQSLTCTYLNEVLIFGKLTDPRWQTEKIFAYTPDSLVKANLFRKSERGNRKNQFLWANYLNTWAENFPLASDENLTLHFVYGWTKKERVNFDLLQYLESDRTNLYQLSGITEEFFPNGNLKIRISNNATNSFIDTLFHENGKPRYFLKLIDYHHYLAEYFDTSGAKIREVDLNLTPPVKETPPIYQPQKTTASADTITYKSYKLVDRSGKKIYYKYAQDLPEMETLSSAEDTEFVYLIDMLRGASLLEKSYNFKTRTRTETITNYFSNNFQITRECYQRFNEDYTAAHCQIRYHFGSHLKVVTDYHIASSFEHLPDSLQTNWYNLEQMHGVSPFSNINITSASFHENSTALTPILQSLDSLNTYYLYDNKPYTGTLEVRFNSNKNKVKITQEKCIVHTKSGFNGNFPSNVVIGQKSLSYNVYLTSDLFPDLVSDFPSAIPLNNDYRNNGRFVLEALKGSSFVSAQLRNGKLDGRVEAYSVPNKITMSFNQGKVTDTSNIYFKENTTPNVQFIHTEPGLVTHLSFNLNGDTTRKYVFHNNSLTYLEMSETYFGRNVQSILYKEKIVACLENAELTQLIYSYSDSAYSTIDSFTFSNGLMHGKTNQPNRKGIYANGLFSGTITSHRSNHLRTEIIEDGLVIREELSSESGIIWKIDYDTNAFKFQRNYITNSASLNAFFYAFGLMESHEITNAHPGRYTSFYSNGEKRSEGLLYYINPVRLWSNSYGDIPYSSKCGSWNYYNSQGELTRVVQYPDEPIWSAQMKVHTYGANSHGPFSTETMSQSVSVELYKKGVLQSHAYVSNYTTIYDCDADEHFEIFNLIVDYDISVDGTQIPFPTRWHQNFYDTGVLQSEGQLVNGQPEGLWKYYDPQGKLYIMGAFKNGLLHGRWLSGDLEGLAYLGDFCMNPETKLDTEIQQEIARYVNIEVNTYKEGKHINQAMMNAYRQN